LNYRRTISKEDQEWLDGAANLVDEECVIETLESAADYEGAVHVLNTRDQVIFEKLTKLANGGGGEQGIKWKHECCGAKVDRALIISKAPNPISKDQQHMA
jgi:hypothetical protein